MRFSSYITEGIIEDLLERGVDYMDASTPVIIDQEENVAFFPLFNFSGKFIGYQRYNPRGFKTTGPENKVKIKELGIDSQKYFTHITKENPEKSVHYMAMYGLHTIDSRRYFFVTEGIFDAVKLIKIGEPAIAALGNTPKPLKNFFFAMQKMTICIADNDEAGKKLKTLCNKSFDTPLPYKDLGEMPENEVRIFITDVKRKLGL